MAGESLRRLGLGLAGAGFCAAAFLLGGVAQAGTVFTDEATFLAAVGGVRLPLPASDAGNFAINGFSFTASAATFSSFVIDTPVYGTAIPGEAGGANLLLNSTESFSVAAPSPIYAFGFAIYRPANPSPIPGDPRGPVACYFTCGTDPFTVALYDGATFVDSFSFTPVDDTIEFHGYWGSSPFDTVDVIEGGSYPENIGDEYFAHFSYGTVAAPEPSTSDGGSAPVRKLRFHYELPNNTGGITETAGFQSVVTELDRHHAAGGAVAPNPPNQSGLGWLVLSASTYDNLGNLSQAVRGPNMTTPECTTISYDAAYQHLGATVRRFVAGCGGASVDSALAFDRGFGVQTDSLSPALGRITTSLDPFGRPLQVFRPAEADPTQKALAVTIRYHDSGPVPYVIVDRVVDDATGETIRSVRQFNGLREPVLNFTTTDATRSNWIEEGWVERNASGQPSRMFRPSFFAGDPTQIGNAGSIASDRKFLLQYDLFGRTDAVYEITPNTGTTQLVKRTFSPLVVTEQDAEQLQPGSPHASAFTRSERDGHGRVRRTVQHTSSGDVVTMVDYYPQGEAKHIARSSGGTTPLYERSFVVDSLGRVGQSQEPNTGGNWRYAWDDAGRLVGTSDARGCGKNIHYDGLGRIVGEEYSPCLASQPPYTRPNLATGDGFEVLNRYDSYESGQLEADPTFPERASFANGNLVSVRDRGSITRFNYDLRGRVRRVSRRPIKPDSVATGTSPYSPHWYKKRLDYDAAGRPVRETSGADVSELLLAGASEETIQYSQRGLNAIASSYGPIVQSTEYDENGDLLTVNLGDVAGTFAAFTRDERQRLTRYQINRHITPDVWRTPTATYSRPPSETTPLVLADFLFDLDGVGNPIGIRDLAQLTVPDVSQSFTQRFTSYDDLYRVTDVTTRLNFASSWQSPYEAELDAGNRRPVPLQTALGRVAHQSFGYDALGNVTMASSDQGLSYDSSLGTTTQGTATEGPNQLRTADGVHAGYDPAGNLIELKVERTGAQCPSHVSGSVATDSFCAQWFVYDWDEVGQLARARRWDFASGHIPPTPPGTLPTTTPTWDLSYAYSLNRRVLKTSKDGLGTKAHTLEIFDSLRLDRTPYDAVTENYVEDPDHARVFLSGGMAQIFYDSSSGPPPRPEPSKPPLYMYFTLPDHLGSAAVTIDSGSSEMVERTMYLGFGATEMDYRPERWKAHREDYKFTGKEEDIEVGLTYFGARYYQPYLGRWASPDPMTIHGPGSNLNLDPYAYVGGRVMTHVDRFGLTDAPEGAFVNPDGSWIAGTPGGPNDYESGGGPNDTPTGGSTEAFGGGAPNDTPTGGPTEAFGETGQAATLRDVTSFQRGDSSALGQSQTAIDVAKSAAIEALPEAALALVDPIGVNRNFIRDVLTATNTAASPLSRGVAGGSAVLSVIPMAGEVKLMPGALAKILTATRTSEELAQTVLSVGRGGQTVAVLETAEGVRLVGGGRKDLSPLQRIFSSALGLVPTNLAGAHAEGTVVEGAIGRGLTPTRGVTTTDICWVCERDLTNGTFGIVFEIVSDRVFVPR